jgi:hypothetical protein
MFSGSMNFSYTFSDKVGLRDAGILESAAASVTMAIYDAVKYDPKFRENSFALLQDKRHTDLNSMLRALLLNEEQRKGSDAMLAFEDTLSILRRFAKKTPYDMTLSSESMRASAAEAERLAIAMDMVDSNDIDLIACYKEAYSRFDIEMGLYRELTRRR